MENLSVRKALIFFEDFSPLSLVTFCHICCAEFFTFFAPLKVKIEMDGIVSINREKTAFVVPNAISIQTPNKRVRIIYVLHI